MENQTISKAKVAVYRASIGLGLSDKEIKKIMEALSKVEKETETDVGVKNDDGKNRLGLIPPDFIQAAGRGFTYGARKYSPYNWAKGIKYERVYGALQRHLWAWWNREDIDQESGLSHLDHACACLAMLVAYEERGMLDFDDRPNAKRT